MIPSTGFGIQNHPNYSPPPLLPHKILKTKYFFKSWFLWRLWQVKRIRRTSPPRPFEIRGWNFVQCISHSKWVSSVKILQIRASWPYPTLIQKVCTFLSIVGLSQLLKFSSWAKYLIVCCMVNLTCSTTLYLHFEKHLKNRNGTLRLVGNFVHIRDSKTKSAQVNVLPFGRNTADRCFGNEWEKFSEYAFWNSYFCKMRNTLLYCTRSKIIKFKTIHKLTW